MKNVFFYLGLGTLFTHELDAVSNHEWRVLPILRSLPEMSAMNAFVLLHIPIFAVVVALVASAGDPAGDAALGTQPYEAFATDATCAECHVDITRQHPEIISLMFTNGTLIDEAMLDRFQGQRNLVPVLSIEGYQEDTDGRRGQGVYAYLQTVIPKLQARDIFYAVSMTVTGRCPGARITLPPWCRTPW